MLFHPQYMLGSIYYVILLGRSDPFFIWPTQTKSVNNIMPRVATTNRDRHIEITQTHNTNAWLLVKHWTRRPQAQDLPPFAVSAKGNHAFIEWLLRTCTIDTKSLSVGIVCAVRCLDSTMIFSGPFFSPRLVGFCVVSYPDRERPFADHGRRIHKRS